GGAGDAIAIVSGDEHAQPDSARAGFLQRLNFAEANGGGELVAFADGDFGVGGSGVHRSRDDIGSELPQVGRKCGCCAHRPVPPTVMRSSLTVGMPTPTGTLWPSLPQVPMPSSSARSWPTIDTCFSASGPLPMRVASRTGAVTLPSSMRYASEAEKTNLPLVMST